MTKPKPTPTPTALSDLRQSIDAAADAAQAYLSALADYVANAPLEEEIHGGVRGALRWTKSALAEPREPQHMQERHPLCRVHLAAEDGGCPATPPGTWNDAENEACAASRLLARHVDRIALLEGVRT